MAQIISIGTALLRINPTNNKKIEYSSNGKYWTTHYTGSTYGEFYDLLLFGSEIFAVTSKGLYVSKNEGRNWSPRYTRSRFHNCCLAHAQLLLDVFKTTRSKSVV